MNLSTKTINVFKALILLITLITSFHFVSAVRSFGNQEVPILIRAGSLIISNSSSQQDLFESPILGQKIGQTFNVTISLQGNSSSAIKIVLASYSVLNFEGAKEFTVTPNETHSELYVTHFVSDLSPWFNLQVNLFEPENNASGLFQVEQTHPGYSVYGGQTGDLYVDNITAWLLTQSQSTSQSTTSVTQATPLTSSLVVIFVLLISRSKRNLKK